MQSLSPRLPVRLVGIAAVGAVLLTGCSSDRLVEAALERVDGVEGVNLDSDDGTITIETEDGEISIDVDEDEGTSTMTTEEGTVTTTTGGELPAVITAAITLPASFTLEGVSELDADGQTTTLVGGTVDGAFDQLMADMEASARAAGWAEVEATIIVEGAMGGIRAEGGEGDGSLNVNLIMDDGDGEGILQVVLLGPTTP